MGEKKKTEGRDRRRLESRAESLPVLLRGSGLVLRRVGKSAAGEAFSVTFPGESQPQGMIVETATSLGLAVQVALPPDSDMAGVAHTSDRVLQLLGALNLGLQSQGFLVSPLAHARGLEGWTISQHVCRDLRSGELLSNRLLALHRTARRVFEALSEPASRLFVAVRKASGIRHVAQIREERRGTPALIPTFDRLAMELMMKRDRRRRRRHTK